MVYSTVKRIAQVVFVLDVLHVFNYLNSYYEEEEEQDQDNGTQNDDMLREDAEVLANYGTQEKIISEEEFEKVVQTILAEMKQSGNKSGLYALDQPGMKVMRESIVFAGGGRATFLQLAHPFIAAGIRDHSELERGVSRRFYNTFKFMFGMTFGTPEDMLLAAKTVRHLHNRVNGQIGEEVGIFGLRSTFDANQEHAIRWVGATLLETAVFEYEMHVQKLSEEEKDGMVREGYKLLMLFGARPRPNDPKTWKQFRRHMSIMFRSKLLTVSETAKDTTEFLLFPPTPKYGPLLGIIHWSTIVSLPPRIAKQYYNRTPSFLDRVLFAIFHGYLRFSYRLLPPAVRYLTAYWNMMERVYGKASRNVLARTVSSLAANVTNRLLAMAMPDRDPEETKLVVVEKRKHRISFDKVTNSPLKV